MKIYKGETGLNESWQSPFSPNIKCKKCGGNARIMFVAIENEREQEEFITQDKTGFICDIYENMKDNKYWVHDACAVAVYLCEDCFEVNAEINQA
jgi:hypothetical protein